MSTPKKEVPLPPPHAQLVVVHWMLCTVYGLAKRSEAAVRSAPPPDSPLVGLLIPALKALPIWTLAFLLLGFTARMQQPMLKPIVVGLLLSSVGDLFLELAPEDTGIPEDLLFVGGLLSFLLAHLFYVRAFRRGAAAGSRAGVAWHVALLAYGLGLCVVLIPHIDVPLRAPVVVYALVLVAMALTALAQANNALPGFGWRAPCGALTFVVSDSILALDKFYFQGTLPHAKVMVMFTYYLAQLLLALSAVVPPKAKTT